MTIKSLHYNPFDFTTASKAWADRESPTTNRIFNTSRGAFYDIYVKNPYNLTIGNAKRIYWSAEKQTKLESAVCIAATAAASLYVLMLYGSNSYLLGRSLSAAGSKLGFSQLTKVGQGLQIVGDNIFLAGAISVYGTFYALPRKVIENIPKAIQLTSEKISTLAQFLFHHALQPLWRRGIHPLLKEIGGVICVSLRATQNIVEATGHKIAQLSHWTFKTCLRPLWTCIIVPTISLIGKAIQKIALEFTHTAQYLADKIERLAKWTLGKVLAPFWNHVIKRSIHLAKKFITNGISHLRQAIQSFAKKTAQVAIWTTQNVLAPFWKQVIMPTMRLSAKMLRTLITKLGDTIQYIANKTAQAATWMIQNTLIPFLKKVIVPLICLSKKIIRSGIAQLSLVIQHVATKAAQVSTWINRNILTPLWKRVILPLAYLTGFVIYTAIKKTIQCTFWGFKNLFIPCLNAINKATYSAAKSLTNYVIFPIKKALYFATQKVTSSAQTVFQKLISPLARSVGNGFTALGSKIYDASSAAWESAASSWKIAANFFGV